MKCSKFFIVLCLLASFKISALSQDVEVEIIPYFDDKPISFEDEFVASYKGKPIIIDVLKFYISNIQLLEDQKVVYIQPESYYLVDAGVSPSNTIKLNCPKQMRFNTIKFDLGIDSSTNVSGVFGGALDPTNGMYWTWQSGYINFKLEGKHESTKIPSQEFQYHIGGYDGKSNSLQTIELQVNNDAKISLALDIAQILDQTDMSEINHIMSPGLQSVQFSKWLKSSFKIVNN